MSEVVIYQKEHNQTQVSVRLDGEPATIEDFSVVQSEGRRKVTRTLTRHKLDAIICTEAPS